MVINSYQTKSSTDQLWVTDDAGMHDKDIYTPYASFQLFVFLKKILEYI